jgi:hypothetical protein
MAENRILKQTGEPVVVKTSQYVNEGTCYSWREGDNVREIYCAPKDYDKTVESLTRPETKLDRYLRGEDDI